jgi:hypothetical protein
VKEIMDKDAGLSQNIFREHLTNETVSLQTRTHEVYATKLLNRKARERNDEQEEGGGGGGGGEWGEEDEEDEEGDDSS